MSSEKNSAEEGRKYEKLGYASLQNNNVKEAESHFLKALKLMEQSGDETGQAYILGNLGNLNYQSKKLEVAEDYYGRALSLMEKINDVKGMESTLGNLGHLCFSSGAT